VCDGDDDNDDGDGDGGGGFSSSVVNVVEDFVAFFLSFHLEMILLIV